MKRKAPARGASQPQPPEPSSKSKVGSQPMPGFKVETLVQPYKGLKDTVRTSQPTLASIVQQKAYMTQLKAFPPVIQLSKNPQTLRTQLLDSLKSHDLNSALGKTLMSDTKHAVIFQRLRKLYNAPGGAQAIMKHLP